MTRRRSRLAAASAATSLLLFAALATFSGCGEGSDPGAAPSATPASPPGTATPDAPDAAVVDAALDAAAGAAVGSTGPAPAGAQPGAPADPDGDGLPGTSQGCPADMVLVDGDYCPNVDQVCVRYHDEYEKDRERKKKQEEQGEGSRASTVSERCLEYRAPTECLSKKRTPMRYCMDRYEWPNKKGEVPMLLISWVDAKKTCESIGKRLCTEDEFNLACEGEEMLPYTYGYTRDPAKCNIDRPYRKREKKLRKYERCMKDPRCKAELARIDQRAPAGSMPQCVSPFGIYDLNGNINEWVVRPGKKYPDRSGLKGGWWGPVRGRCRPTVGFHKEEDYGYEEGFRCCKDAEP